MKRQVFGIIIGLAVEFLLGMAINLFVSFPQGSDVGKNWDFASHNLLVMTHVIIGTLLVLGAIVLVVRVFRNKIDQWKLPAVVGLISLLVAWGAGDGFVATQKDTMSFLMAAGFVVGIIAYAWGLAKKQ